MGKCIVVIADIEGSKEIKEKDREILQQDLQEVLDERNNGNEGILSPYTITLGDEFQAVLGKADYLFLDMFRILAVLHPVGVRFSIGVGEVVTPINQQQAIGMDGPAFHEAREGINQLKESGFLFGFRIEGGNDLDIKIINNSLQLLSKEMRKWNKRRMLILQMLMEGYDYKFISDKLEISTVAFYKNKDAGALDIIDELSDNIIQAINKRLEE